MKQLASVPRPSTADRVTALEEGRKADTRRIGAVEEKLVKVDEMHEILVGLRQIGRAVRFMIYWFGGPSMVAGVALYAWKSFIAH